MRMESRVDVSKSKRNIHSTLSVISVTAWLCGQQLQLPLPSMHVTYEFMRAHRPRMYQ
jgi:hypothetical protein